MDLTNYTSPGTDQYGRKFPTKIIFTNGDILYGHFASSRHHLEGEIIKTTNIHFLIIKNIEDWINNMNEEIANREVITFNDDKIDRLSIFKSY
ncbi:MAG: hypothetical protein EXR20_08400 [Bacteroidetes bacterium]|nr:hypothetical protein [Bacteroidota bacterium]